MDSYSNQDYVVEELIGKQGISSPVSQSQKFRNASSYQAGEQSEVRKSLAEKFGLKEQPSQLQSSIAIQKLLGISPVSNNAGQTSVETYASQVPLSNTPAAPYTSTLGIYGGVTENNNLNTIASPSLISGQVSANIQGLDYRYDNKSNIPSYNSITTNALAGLDTKSDLKLNQIAGNYSTQSYLSALPSSLDNKYDLNSNTINTNTNYNYTAGGIQEYKPYVPSSTQATIGTNISTTPYVPLTSAAPILNNYSVRASQEYFPITDSKQLIKDTNQTKVSAIVEKMDLFNTKNQDIYGSLQVNNQLKYGGSISGVNSIRDTMVFQGQNLTSNIKDSITYNPSLISNSPKNYEYKAASDSYKIQNVLSKFSAFQPTSQAVRSSGLLKNSSSQLNLIGNYTNNIPNESVEETIKRANNTLKQSLLKSSSAKNLNSNFNTNEVSINNQIPSYTYATQINTLDVKLPQQEERVYTKDSVIQDFIPSSQTYQASKDQFEEYSSKYKVNTKESVIQDFTPSIHQSKQNQQTNVQKINNEYLNTKQSEIQDFDPSKNPQTFSNENKANQYEIPNQNYFPPASSVKSSTFTKNNPITSNVVENSRAVSYHKPSNSISQSPIRENPPSFAANMFNATPSKYDELRVISNVQAGTYSTNWQQIIQKGENDGIEFSDSEFPATIANIGGKYPDVVSWLRPRDIFNSGFEVFVKGIDPTTLISGDLGDYYFQSAVSALAERDYSILKLFQTKSVNKAGCYVLNICWKGVWTSVILDDKIPTKGNKQICFTRSSSSELWAMLLEKAWAKLHGSYAKIDGGLVREVLHDFTGAPCRNFFTQGEGYLNRQQLWQRIQYAEDKDLIVLASCMDDLLSTEQEEIKELFGISNVHPYTILGTICLKYQNKDYKFIKLRNTYVKQEWLPNSEDKYFNRLPAEVINKLNYGGRCTREGFFLMEYEFFYKFFTDVQICYQYLGYQYTGEKLCTMTAQRNYFKLQISQAGYYFFQVSQQSIRTERISDQILTTERDYYSQVYLVVAPESKPSQPIVAVKGNQRDLTSYNYIDNPIYLPQGEYLAFVEVDWRSNSSSSGNCGFGAYGSNYIDIRVSNSGQCPEFSNYIDTILNENTKWEQV